MHIGQPIQRGDGPAKVTGEARYVDDIKIPGCWHGTTIRSTRAHARILSIAQDPAYNWEDIVLVTARDIPGENVVALMTDDQPVLADSITRHTSEPIALIAAPTRDRALEAAKHIQIAYQDLPAVLDPCASTQVFKHIKIHKQERKQAGIRHTNTYTTGLADQLYIEPQGMIAIPPQDDHDSLTIIGSLQCPYYIHKALKRVLGHTKFHVIQATTGGGFGGKEEYPSLVAAHASLLALATRRPIKIIYRRDEDLRATTKRHPAQITITSETSPEGELLSWDVQAIVDGGAYNTLSPVVLSRLILHATGPYRCPEMTLEGRVVATHTPPNGAYRGFGAPQAQFAVERHMDLIARSLGIDPLTFRQKNLLQDGDITATGQVLKDTGAHKVLEEVLKPVPEPPNIRPRGSKNARYRRGTGIGLAFHGCGFTGNGESWLKGKAAVELHGQTIKILTGSTDIGQGTDTIFPQIVASELGVPLSQVEMVPHDTALVPDSGPTVASRTCMVVGSVVQTCAKKLYEAILLEVGGPGSFAELLARRTRSEVIRVEHVYEPDASIQWEDSTYSGDAYPTYGWSANKVELEVDLDTGEVHYLQLVTATDVGRAINSQLVTGQIEGGALQALGWATLEEVVLDDQGGMKNDRITNYIIPTPLDAPEMITRLVEIPYSNGPFGAKGVGEIPLDAPAAAVAAAIEQACGAVLNSLPMTPERVLSAILV